MKKWLAVVLLAALLCGCSAEAPAEAGPELILRYADNQPAGYPTTEAAEYFAELVAERTDGKILIRVYCDGELGDENSVMEQVQFGGIDFSRVSVGTLAEVYPKVELLQLPYLYDDADHMWRVLDGEIGEEFLLDVSEVGLVGLSWFDAGARSFYTSSPVTCLADLRGMTIRVQESAFMSRIVELLGAVPVQIPYGDVYSALQTAQIDGAENNWPSYESTGHYEAAPYFIRDEHSRLPEMQIVSTVAMEKIAQIGEEYVEVIYQCARESAVYERKLWQQREQEAEQDARERGCIVTELDEARIEEFRQAVQPAYESYTDEYRELLQRIREA